MTGFYWIASYPKSGNTWLRLFLQSLSGGGGAVDLTVPLDVVWHAATRPRFEEALELESGDLTNDEITCARPRQYEIEAAAAAAPLWRKVHDRWGLTPAQEPLFPPGVTLGIIYLVRDPRDIAISFAHHNNTSLDETIAGLAHPKYGIGMERNCQPKQLPQHLGSWSGHVQSWLDTGNPRLLVIRYEDLSRAPEAHFAAAADFLGIKAAPAQIAAAVQAVRFDVLQAAEDRHGFRERPAAARRFFRQGTAGGWRGSLTARQVARIESDHGAVMQRLGYGLSGSVPSPAP